GSSFPSARSHLSKRAPMPSVLNTTKHTAWTKCTILRLMNLTSALAPFRHGDARGGQDIAGGNCSHARRRLRPVGLESAHVEAMARYARQVARHHAVQIFTTPGTELGRIGRSEKRHARRSGGDREMQRAAVDAN